MSAVGVIGVGAMGLGVAQALLAKGFTVFVRDIVPGRQDAAVAAGALGRERDGPFRGEKGATGG